MLGMDILYSALKEYTKFGKDMSRRVILSDVFGSEIRILLSMVRKHLFHIFCETV